MNTNITAARGALASWFTGGGGFVLGVFVASRLLILGIIVLSKTIIVRGNFWHDGGVMSVLTQWDGAWYLSIARNGYEFSTERQSNMGFFPFYPMLVKLVSYVFHDVAQAGVITSNLCLLAAGLLLYRLVSIDYPDRKVPRSAVLFLMFSPVSFFFSSAYTESTFIMLVIAAFFAARKGQWLVAGLLGMMVSATRQVGLLLVLPLFVEYVRQSYERGFNLRVLLHPRIILLGLVPLGLFLFMLYGQLRFSDFFAFFHATAVWGRHLSSPLSNLAHYERYGYFYRWLFLGTLGAAAALCAAGLFLRVRASYLVFTAVMILIYISSNSLEAIPRNLSVLFPLFIVMGIISSRFEWTYEPMLATSTGLLTLCTILAANGFWMT